MSTPRSAVSAPAVVAWGAPKSCATTVVLAVHGRGQSPDYMRTESQRLLAAMGRAGAAVRFVAPHASGDSWYPRPFQEPLAENQPELDAALDTVGEVLAGIGGLAPVILWGFSQGACLSAHLLLTRDVDVDAALICTGGHLGTDVAPMPTRRLDGLPVVLRSIVDDPYVPPDRVRATATAFERASAAVDLRIDAGSDHIITDEAMDTMAAVIQEMAR